MFSKQIKKIYFQFKNFEDFMKKKFSNFGKAEDFKNILEAIRKWKKHLEKIVP